MISERATFSAIHKCPLANFLTRLVFPSVKGVRVATDGGATSTSQTSDTYDPLSTRVKQDPVPSWKSARDHDGVHKYVLPDALASQIANNPLASRSPKEFY